MKEKLARLRALTSRLPRAQLGFFPTPLYRLNRLSEALGIELYIKRDDFTGMNLFGGNKVRKLEYLLGDAAQRGATHVITYGATQSNHAMETAAACRRLGMQPILYLTVVVEPEKGSARANLLLDQILGAEIHTVPMLPGESEEDADARAAVMGAARAAELNAAGQLCVDIPMGGASRVGSVGFVDGMAELAEQLEEMGVQLSKIYHCTGTGGTMAGMHVGRSLLGSDVELISVAASPKQEQAYLDKVHALCGEVLDLLGSDVRVKRDDLHLDLTQWQPGYEQPSEAASEAIRLLARTEGLFVDPVYTGKALAALLADVRSGKIAKGERVLFWHTGGATALFAEPEILGEIC